MEITLTGLLSMTIHTGRTVAADFLSMYVLSLWLVRPRNSNPIPWARAISRAWGWTIGAPAWARSIIDW